MHATTVLHCVLAAGGGATAATAGGGGGGKAKKEEEEARIDMLDIRVGQIVKVDQHPNADSLYLEEIDLGEGQPRQVCGHLLSVMLISYLCVVLMFVGLVFLVIGRIIEGNFCWHC